jgi:hypothetical protein
MYQRTKLKGKCYRNWLYKEETMTKFTVLIFLQVTSPVLTAYETSRCSILSIINPYVDLSLDFGKEYRYEVPESWFGEQLLLSYEGLNLAAGMEVRPQNFPATVHGSVLKPILINADEFLPDNKVYWEIGGGVTPYKRNDLRMDIGTSYLRNFGDFCHSTFVLLLNVCYEYRAFDLRGNIGGYVETDNAGGSRRIKEHPFFMSLEIAVAKWPIVPYISGGLIYRYYETEAAAVFHPVHEQLMPVYSIGVRLRLNRPSFMMPMIMKMSPPKGREHIS